MQIYRCVTVDDFIRLLVDIYREAGVEAAARDLVHKWMREN